MPRFSPDGKYLAFRSSRQSGKQQIWLLNLAGGEAEKISDFAGDVTDFVWSGDSRQLAVIAEEPDPETPFNGKTPPPIVIDQFHFLEDGVGFIGKSREHLYVLDLATRKADILTPGSFNEYLPAWSPDSKNIAFVSKRGQESDRNNNWDLYVMAAQSGAKARQLTTFVPGFGIQTRRVGLDFWVNLSCFTRVRRATGVRALTPSTPAVLFPLLSCVTLLTAMHFADQDLIRVFWSRRTALTSPRLEA